MMNMDQMMRQAKRMQQEMTRIQDQLAQQDFEGESSAGAVKAVVTGKQKLKSLKLDPQLLKESDSEMLADLIVVAVNNALKNSQDTAQKEMNKISGGFQIPGF